MLLAPVPLTVVCVEIASNVAMCLKPLKNQWFCMVQMCSKTLFASSFCRRRFFRSTTFAGHSWCPEVGLRFLDSAWCAR